MKKETNFICPVCGIAKYFKPSVLTKRRFCSQHCEKQHSLTLYETIECLLCKKHFVAKKSAHAKYCSISCGVTARNLTDQNPSYHRDVSGSKNPMYGRRLFGPANPMFGKRKEDVRKPHSLGYWLVRAPDGHPYPCDQSSGTSYILEHRLVMERHIGRYLDPKEVVHHKDRNPKNNAIENLVLYKDQAEHMALGHPCEMRDKKRAKKLLVLPVNVNDF